MKSLREEIDRRLASNQVYYAHFVTNMDMEKIRKESTNDILKIIEKRIDKRIRIVSKECNCGNSEVHENILNEYEHFRDLILK